MDRIKRTLTSIPTKTWLGTIIALGLLARLLAVLIMGDTVEVLPGIYDQVSYHTLATRLLDGHGFTFETEWWPVTQAGEPTAHWSYLYTFYLTVVYNLVGVHPIAARLLQVLLVGILMPLLTFRLAARLPVPARRWAGAELLPLLSAAWIAFYPYFIYYSAALMTEMFYITVILWSLELAISITWDQGRQPARRSWMQFALLGLALGSAVLLRQVYLAFIPFLLTWMLLVRKPAITRQEGKDMRKGIVIVGVVLMGMVLPFTLWNYHQFGRLVLLNTNAGYAFFWANHPFHGDDFIPLLTPPMPTYQELIPDELRSMDEAALEKELMRRGMRFVLDDPVRYLRLSLSRIDDHFIFWPKADSSRLSNITRVTSLGVALPFMLLGAILWLVYTWYSVEGKFCPRLGRLLAQPGGLLLLFLLIYVGIHLASWAGIRYRLPADAVMLPFAAYSVIIILNKLSRHRENPVSD
jgi:hypothetical protein